MSELRYNEPAERFAPFVEKSICAGATAVMVPSETGCWVHYADYCERIAKVKSEADKAIAHHKYKRCLDNAWWCRKLSNAYAWSASNLRGWKIAVYYDKKAELYRRWHKRWLELAKKFKEGV